MSQDEFTKLFKYMTERFDKVDTRFDQQEKRFDDLTAGLAEIARQLKDYHKEMLMLAHKVDRLERWINQIAQKTGVKLDY